MTLCKGTVVAKRFTILKKLGKGGYGDVYKARDMDHNNEVALKVEPISRSHALCNERVIYSRLWERQFPIGIPHPIAYLETSNHVAIVMPLFGESLRDVMVREGGLSIKSVAYIGIQMLKRLEHIHRHGIVHLDIKPENMMLGRGMDRKTVYMIDFGLSRRFVDRSGRQKRYCEDVAFCGTRAYSSVYRDSFEEVSQRDDLESLMYSLVMLYKGRLPWCSGDYESVSYDTIEECKVALRNCVCQGMPKPMRKAWRNIRTLSFGETPQYDELSRLFYEAAAGCTEDDGMKFNLE